MTKVEIIAECGINHGGKIDTAIKMIKEAKKAGADTVKFQLVDPDFYEKGSELYNIFKECFLPISDHFKLKRQAEKLGLNYLCTPSDERMAKALVEAVGVNRLKVASDSAKDLKLVQYIEQNNRLYLISTGHMKSAKEIIELAEKLDPDLATILYCVSKYPCPMEEAGIETIRLLKSSPELEYFNIGYSDHTEGILAPFLAVGAGATVIEKHFKIDSNCVDAPVSLFPDDFERMVNLIRDAEKML